MLTIGRLSRHTGVPARTIRSYHATGVLPEPARDRSGYRRYSASDAADLVRIRTMGAAGVPLADIRQLLSAGPVEFLRAVDAIERRLDIRMGELQATRVRLRQLTAGTDSMLPKGVPAYLDALRDIGTSRRWIDTEEEW